MSEAKWYVVHTYSGYENKVKVDIEKTIENRHLEDQILEVRVPLQEVAELKNGALKQVQKKMFPGYVLLNMVMNDDTWYVVRNTRGVTGFVGPGSKPVPLTEEEMLPLGIKKEEIQVDFAEGDTVVVTGGAWKDTVGVITVYADRSFSFITKTPPAAVLLKKAANIKSGSGVPNKTKVAKVTKAQIQEIAELKMKDLNAASLEAAMSMISGTARSMGIEVVD